MQEQRETLIDELRQESYGQLILIFLGCVLGLAFCAFWANDTQALAVFLAGLPSSVLLGLSFFLPKRYLPKYHLLSLAYIVFAGLLYFTLDPIIGQYALVLIPMITVPLVGRVGMFYSLIAGGFILGVHFFEGGPSTLESPLAPLWLLLSALVIAWQGYERLGTAVAWAWRAYSQAKQRTEEAQKRRAQLLRVSQDLKRANQRLERLNRQLARAHQEAEEARQMKAQFAANISHELRTPLNLIVGFGEMLLTAPEFYGPQGLPPRIAGDIMTIYRNAKHLLSLVDDVLDLSQLEAGSMTIQPERGELNQVIEEAVEACRRLFRQRGLYIHLDLPRDLPPLYFDRARIRQVVINLLINAARFTQEGGVTIRSWEGEEGQFVSVQDTGIGIRPADLGRVFEPFQQLDASLTRKREGIGLGLAISKHFVELHGGKIWVESTFGKGTTFTFMLPYPEHSQEHLELVRTSLPLSRAEARESFILLERDEAVRSLFRRHLEAFDLQVAEDWAEAVQKAKALGALAIVADRALWDGEAQQWVRQAQENGSAVLICPLPNGRRNVQMMGLDDLLIKPFKAEDLRRRLADMSIELQRVVVADCEVDMVRLVERILSNWLPELEIIKAYDERELLESLTTGVDLVLFDLLLTSDPQELILHIRQQCDGQCAPKLVGMSDRWIIEALTPSPHRDVHLFLPMPLRPLEAVKEVESLLQGLAKVRPTTNERVPQPTLRG
ncbi:MAG: hypothetical protein J7M05_02020 [Anaerolineae bacterium]|nr:hypothetical protein [Anaerolineae bacterium]